MRKLIPGVLALVAAAAFSLWAYPHLPAQVATHFGLHGEPNGWSSRLVAAALMPALGLVIAAVFLLLPRIDPRGANYAKFGPTYWTIANAVLILVSGLHVVMLGKALGWAIDMTRMASLGVGGLLVLLGNLMTRIRSNWFVGIRTPWTLSSDTVWRKTHRFGGVAFVIAGLCVVAAALVDSRWALFGALAAAGAAAVGSVVYSYVVWKGEQGTGPQAGSGSEWQLGWLLLAAGVLAAAPARAQEQVVDAGLFRLFQSGAELGRESFRRTAKGFESSMELPVLSTRLVYRGEYDAAGRIARFELRGFNLATDSLTIVYEVVVSGDSLHFTQTRPGATPAQRRWSHAAIVDAVSAPQSVANLLALVDRSERRDTTYRAWGVGEDSVVTIAVSFHGDTARLASGPFEVTSLLGPTGRVQAADAPIQRVHIERWPGGDSLPPLPGAYRPAPDYSAPPDAPYTAEEVRVPVRPATGDTFSLAGTLTFPRSGRRPFPAAVMITGSGLEDRDENLWPLVQGYRPFRQIAERLAQAGIAVLRVDDRSFGGSTGNARDATTADFTDDLAAEVAWLRERSGIDAARIALIGHSEGGVIAPMLAARDRRIAAIVLMAGSAKTGVRVLVDQMVGPIQRASDLAPQRRAELEAEAARSVEADTAPASKWMRWFRDYDPLPTARQVRQPVLILQGALDRQVSAGQADTLAEAMRSAGNRDVTEGVFPHLNHLFLVSPTDGSPSEYPALKDTSIPRDVLDTLADWLARRLTPGRGRGGR